MKRAVTRIFGPVRRTRRAAARLRLKLLTTLGRRVGALNFWRAVYGTTWNAELTQQLVEREGELVGRNSIYASQPFRLEEYNLLDALLRHFADRRSEVRVLDVACGTGLACFFIAANRDRYGDRIRYVGVDASDSQLLIARVRNPWSFASFTRGNLFATGLADKSFDLVLNWQCVNHVGHVEPALRELTRVCRGVVYLINYAYFDEDAFVRRYGSGRHEAQWGELAWAFNRDHVSAYIDSLGARQLWRASCDQSFTRSLPQGSTAEHTLLIADGSELTDWSALRFDGSWRASLERL